MKKNVFYFVLSSLIVCCSFDLDLTTNVKDSAEISCLSQQDSLSIPIAVPKQEYHSGESHRKDRDWEHAVTS